MRRHEFRAGRVPHGRRESPRSTHPQSSAGATPSRYHTALPAACVSNPIKLTSAPSPARTRGKKFAGSSSDCLEPECSVNEGQSPRTARDRPALAVASGALIMATHETAGHGAEYRLGELPMHGPGHQGLPFALIEQGQCLGPRVHPRRFEPDRRRTALLRVAQARRPIGGDGLELPGLVGSPMTPEHERTQLAAALEQGLARDLGGWRKIRRDHMSRN